MAMAVQQMHPGAHWPLVLGVWRRLEGATMIDRLLPPHPAHGLSCGRGVEALVLAILDGDHALYKVGRRREERGMVALLQPGWTRASLNDYRWGHLREALFAANLNRVLGAVALKALEVSASPTPWLHQDTTTLTLYGAYEDEPQSPEAPHPAYGHRKDGRHDLTQVLLSLGVSGESGRPLRVGIRDGHRRDRVETPLAIEACLAWGLEGVRGIVAASKADSRRTRGWCLAQGIGWVPLVPRPGAVRQELEAWGQQPPPLPLLAEKPGRPKAEAPRRWQGQSGIRQVEVEDSAGRTAPEEGRFVVVPARQLAPPHAQSYGAAPVQAAKAVAAHGRQVHARWFACRPDAEAASAAYEGRGRGRRGRRPRPWRSPTIRDGLMADTRRTRRARRGRPAKTDPPPTEAGDRLRVEVEAVANPEEDNGGTVLATTVSAERCTDSEILRAYQEQNTPGEAGVRWIKHPAAISPVWREKPARIAALAMLTVVGLLVSSVIQRQVRLYRLTHAQQISGNKGLTAIPTAAVVLAWLAHVALIQWVTGDQQIEQISGVQPHPLLLCDALGLDSSWYAVPSAQKTGRTLAP